MSPPLANPSAPPGKSDKYARREFERRFLLARVPDGEVRRVARIVDRYVIGSRLRVRTMTEEAGPGARSVTHKLTQKVPALDGSPGLLTTIYLNDDEHRLLCALPARVLEKTRLSIDVLAVDVFEGAQSGLVLAEAELDSEEDLLRFVPPPYALCEVTRDARFSGGRLAEATGDDVRALLSEHGLA